jgi:hypothetical protein
MFRVKFYNKFNDNNNRDPFSVIRGPIMKYFKILIAALLLASCFISAVEAAPTVQLLSPSAGDNVGRHTEIKWIASDPVGFPVNPVSLYYSLDNGNTYNSINQNTENDGREWWWVGDKMDNSEVKIKIEIVNLDNEIAALESETFNIISIPYTYLASALPSVLVGGTTQEISWRAYDAAGDLIENPVSIYYSTDYNGPWTTLIENQPAEGTYIWGVPPVNASWAYLKFEALDSKGNKGGDSFSFSIRTDPPSLDLILPDGGESLVAGEIYTIDWGVDNPIGLQDFPFTLYYSSNGGEDYVKIVEGLEEYSRIYDWQVPAVNSSNAKIKITATDVFGQVFEAESSSPFTISIPPIGTINSPNGGEVLKGGGTVEISWNEAEEGMDPADYTVNLKSSVNGGEWQEIVTGELNDGSYSWDVPAIDDAEVKIKTEIINANQEVIASDESDDCFTIDSTPPQLTLAHPQAGTIYKAGIEGLRIAYEANDANGFPSGGINIYYSGDGGGSYSWIYSTNYTNYDTTWWISSATDTDNAKVKIEAQDKAGWVITVESETFSVATYPDVNISSPGWGMILEGGTQQTIEWNASDKGNDLIPNPITIKFSSNEGETWEIIAADEANDGSCSWTVPELDVSYSKGRIRIEAKDDGGHVGYEERNVGIDSTPPEVTLTYPNGGEDLYAGQNYYIKWDALDSISLYSTSLYYSTDSGENYVPIAENVHSYGVYSWTVPELESDQVRIKVVVYDAVGHAAADESDADFSIAIPAFGAVLAPNGGEHFMSYYTVDIRWKSDGDGIDTSDYLVDLSYQIDDGDWQVISTGEVNDGSYVWVPSGVDSTKVKVRVEMIKEDEIVSTDESDDYFIVEDYNSNEGIIITSPSEGDVWTAGSTYRISWDIDPEYTLTGEDSINIYMIYTHEDTLFYADIARQMPADKNYIDWKVPLGITASSATIEVYGYGWHYFSGSSGSFSIVSPLVVSNPEGKEKIIFDPDSIPVIKSIDFERIDLPADSMPGAEALEKALRISSDPIELDKAAEVFMPVPTGAINPKVFRWDEENNAWESVSAVLLDDKLIFKTTNFGIFAVFEIVDTAGPNIQELKINGRSVAGGDSIGSMPVLEIDILDDYGVDALQTIISVDGAEPKSLSGSNVMQAGISASISYSFSDSDKLSVGSHIFKISAADRVGNTSSCEIALYVVGESITGLMIYPNPYKLGDPDYIKFDGLTEDVRVRVYDIAGSLVWSGQNTPGAASLTWDAVNSAGRQIVPGVYFYIVISNSGGKQSGKIAIIR